MAGLYDPALTDPASVSRAERDLVTIANPSAGAGLTFTVPAGYTLRPLAFHFRIVTDANVANRTVYVQFRDDGGVAFATMLAPVNVQAATTVDFSFWRGLGQADWIGTTPITVPLFEAFLPPAYTIVTTIDTVQAGDQLSRFRLYTEKWPTDGPR